MSITDGTQTRVIGETNLEGDSTEGYIKDIDTTDVPFLYEVEISTGSLDGFYGSSQAFARDGKYTVTFANDEGGTVTPLEIMLADSALLSGMEIGVPKMVEYNSQMYSLVGDNTNLEAKDTFDVSQSQKQSN